MLHLWEIEVRTDPARDELLCVVEEVERKVEYRARYGLVIDCDTGLVQVPSSWPVYATVSKSAPYSQRRNIPDDKHGRVGGQLIRFAVDLKVDLAANGIIQVHLTVEKVGECGRVRVYMVQGQRRGPRGMVRVTHPRSQP